MLYGPRGPQPELPIDQGRRMWQARDDHDEPYDPWGGDATWEDDDKDDDDEDWDDEEDDDWEEDDWDDDEDEGGEW